MATHHFENLAGGYATRVCFLEYGDIFKFLLTDSEFVVIRIAANRLFYKSVVHSRFSKTRLHGRIVDTPAGSKQLVHYTGKYPLKRKHHV